MIAQRIVSRQTCSTCSGMLGTASRICSSRRQGHSCRKRRLTAGRTQAGYDSQREEMSKTSTGTIVLL
jgi:hypothetical protein